jgi:peptidoglycan/xylan/chitin deacetylase (PgdA/CDA1 family)
MTRALKRLLLYVLWVLGLFVLARYLTRKRLRILCYHGGSINDEHLFMPSLFMQQETFRRRVEQLAHSGYPVLSLGEALQCLANGTLPACATVITIDDGFYSTVRDFVEPLREHNFPATIYVTSYHAGKETPVFRLVVQYMFWKTAVREVDYPGLGPVPAGKYPIQTAEEKQRLCWDIINHAETNLSEEQRCDLARTLGKCLGIDYDRLASSRCFNIATAEEVRALARAGLDIQLHTHRHRFPVDRETVTREITENREFLSPLTGKPLEHFCYPSGLWSREHWEWLAALGILSATTCDPGQNTPATPRYALLRFLDGDRVSSIEFAAELCGLADWLRGVRSCFAWILGRKVPRSAQY